jgi:hypothetical protein
VQEVGGSNPLAPTTELSTMILIAGEFFVKLTLPKRQLFDLVE